MKQYCLDTSGLSTPFQTTPEDIYPTLWAEIDFRIKSGMFAVTAEIYEEINHIHGGIGQSIKEHKAQLILEVGDNSWNFESYIDILNRLYPKYEPFISGTGGSKVSLSMPDLSIVILAKTLNLPLISMEKPCAQNNGTKKRKIPDVCSAEGVHHMEFNDFLRKERIKL